MSLLKELLKGEIKESGVAGATGGGAIANVRGSLFGGGPVSYNRSKKKKQQLFRRISSMPENDIKVNFKNRFGWSLIAETLGVASDEPTFDAADVISKLDAAEKRANINKDTVAFGLEDSEGNITKVYVKADEADDFESTLASLLAGEDDDNDEQNTSMEIAEVLHNIKDKFDIVDVEWPQIAGDEEQEQTVGAEEGGEQLPPGVEKEPTDLTPGAEPEPEAEQEPEMAAGEEGGAESALQQVIDMMKADAEAKKAEAEARKEEAKARQAEMAAKTAGEKVKQEEDVLDMEAYYGQKKTEEQETKRLAQLAKYRHDKARDAETKLASEQQELSVNDSEPWRTQRYEEDQTISAPELAGLIMKHLRHN